MANHMEPEQFFCPTFTSYTADNSAETAARVATSSYLDDDDINFEFDLSFTELLQSRNGNMFPSFEHDNSLNGFDMYCHGNGYDSSTSSDGEDQMYCVWRPKKTAVLKQWKLLEFLKRHNSEGKDDFVILTPKKKKNLKPLNVSAVEEFYVRSRAMKEGQKGKSYLPYKKDLVGFFANVNMLARARF